MSPYERRQQILEQLTGGQVSIEKLSKDLGVSEVTIRRDLALLDEQGKLSRVRSGAIPSRRIAYEFSFQEKQARNSKAKEAMVAAAIRLVKPGDAVFIDSGTSAFAVARALRPAPPAIIVTVNLCVGPEYAGHSDVRIMFPGGEMSHHSPLLTGEWTHSMLRNISVDIAFLCCDSVIPSDGFYSAGPGSTTRTQIMLERSRQAYLLADSSKFGWRALCRLAGVEELTGIITDSHIADEYRTELQKMDLDLIIADIP